MAKIKAPDGKIIGELVNEEEGKGSRYCPSCGAPEDHRHLQTDLEIEKDRHQRDVEQLTEAIEQLRSGHPSPKETIKYWLECPNCKPEFESLMKPKMDEAFEKGKAETLAKLGVDDISPQLVGQWIKTMREREKEAK